MISYIRRPWESENRQSNQRCYLRRFRYKDCLRTGWRQQEPAFTLTEAGILQPDDHSWDTI